MTHEQPQDTTAPAIDRLNAVLHTLNEGHISLTALDTVQSTLDVLRAQAVNARYATKHAVLPLDSGAQSDGLAPVPSEGVKSFMPWGFVLEQLQ